MRGKPGDRGHGRVHERGRRHHTGITRCHPVRQPGGLNAAGKALQLVALKEELRRLEQQAQAVEGPDPELELRMAHLQDIIAFESVEVGPTLFEGLRERGLALDPPELLTDAQCAERSIEITNALAEVGVFLFGHDLMGPREFYSTLWHETLHEGCYLKQRRSSASVVVIDVSRRVPREVMASFLEFLQGRDPCTERRTGESGGRRRVGGRKSI